MIQIGIVSPAEIAYRRFMPAIKKIEEFCYIGVAIYSSYERFDKTKDLSEMEQLKMQNEIQKGKEFTNKYGGKLYYSYEELICSDEVDAVYIPLPPSLHEKYAKMALIHGKHVLVEKPSTLSAIQTEGLVQLAKKHSLALYENYMFVYHKQIQILREIIDSGKIGKVRLYSLRFGFPKRAKGDFRYIRDMGGGALLDAGGYTLKLARMLLGDTTQIVCAILNQEAEYDVDLYGSATLINDEHITAQVAFGMDNAYKCEIEVWGSQGTIKTGRIFTAPPGMKTTATICCDNHEEIVVLADDDAFKNSIDRFRCCIENQQERDKIYEDIIEQAKLVEDVIRLAERK